MIKEAIVKLSKKEDLTYQEAESSHGRDHERTGNTGTDVILSDSTFHKG